LKEDQFIFKPYINPDGIRSHNPWALIYAGRDDTTSPRVRNPQGWKVFSGKLSNAVVYDVHTYIVCVRTRNQGPPPKKYFNSLKSPESVKTGPLRTTDLPEADTHLGSILLNRYGRNLRMKPNFVKCKFVITTIQKRFLNTLKLNIIVL
jgi:hypothetical protein